MRDGIGQMTHTPSNGQTPPLGRHPPRADTTPLGRHPPEADTAMQIDYAKKERLHKYP